MVQLKTLAVAAAAMSCASAGADYCNATTYTTSYASAVTSFYPKATQVTYGGTTYNVSTATTLTFPSYTYNIPVYTSTVTSCSACQATSSGKAISPAASSNSSSITTSRSTATTPLSFPSSKPIPTYINVTSTVKSSGYASGTATKPPVASFTGAASHHAAGAGAGLAGLLGLAAYFL